MRIAKSEGASNKMNGGELKRELRNAKCKPTGKGKRHEEWYSPITGKYFYVPRHDSQEIDAGTLHNIFKDAGLK